MLWVLRSPLCYWLLQVAQTSRSHLKGDTNLDKLIMSSMCKTRVADNSKANTLTNPGQKNHWVCPMHPEVHNHEPGKCPICKMNLVKAKPKST